MSIETARPSDDAAQLIINAWRAGRPIVPFLGAGISLAAGFPTIRQLTEYLAKVVFAIEVGIYESRYPIVVDGIDTAYEKYNRRPADFITDFGWPDLRQLNADVWRWINDFRKAKGIQRRVMRTRLKALTLSDITTPSQAIHAVLSKRLLRAEGGLRTTNLRSVPLNGDWSDLLFHLTEGHLDLVDALFTGLDRGRHPTSAHISLAFLTQLMGIRLILSVNFDTLLEQTMIREGIPIRTFDIHRDADLPHPAIVAQQHALIKLHGSAYGLRFGERLNYSLEEDAERRLHEYLADDALMVVIGFSGWERRMMQIIDDFSRRSTGTAHTQVLWLDVLPRESTRTSENLTRTAAELKLSGLLNALRRDQFCDSNSFLSGLLAILSNGFPSSHNRYPVLPSRPRLPWRDAQLDLPGNLDAGVVVISEFPFTKPIPEGARPSSWASFLAAEYAASKQTQKDIVWIDLENHHTVEGVVKDIFRQIRNVDPTVPQLFLPAEADVADYSSLQRATSRLRAALLRGNYLVVFDSVESFSRPQLVHHGLPSHFTKKQKRTIQTRLDRLGVFLDLLTNPRDRKGYITPDLQSTVVVLTATLLSTRHASSRHNKLLQDLNEDIRKLARKISQHGKLLHRQRVGDNSYIGNRRKDHDDALAVVRTQLPSDRVPWGQWATYAVAFRETLATQRLPPEFNLRNSTLFLAFLSVLRRPRPRPLISCMLSRWLFDPGNTAFPFQLANITNTIDRLLLELHKGGYIEFLEGETVWIPRTAKEDIYRRISAPLHFATLTNRDNWASATISGLLLGTWHLQAARVYFADIYVTTHDDQAFFEYEYHRVAGLRYLAIVQSLLDEGGDALISEVNDMVEPQERSALHVPPNHLGNITDRGGDNFVKLEALIPPQFKHFCAFIAGIGAFAFVRRDPELGQKLDVLKSKRTCKAVGLALWHSRIHGIVTLENALRREQDRISSTTTPDTWLGWIEQLLNSELFYIIGDWVEANAARGIVGRVLLKSPRPPENSAFDNHYRNLFRTLRRIKVHLLRRKFDYQAATKELALQLWPQEARHADFVESMSNWVLRGGSAGNYSTLWQRPNRRNSGQEEYLAAAEVQVDFIRSVSVKGSSEHIRTLTAELWRSVSQLPIADVNTRKKTELYVLQLLCGQAMNDIPMWDQTPRAAAVRQEPNKPSRLRDALIGAERITHQMEDLYRQVAESSEEYATYRSKALSLRARSAYLRGQFREAHRILNLALSDLGEHSVPHRFARAVVDMYRAELLWISARDHLLLNPGGSAASIRKAETAISSLDTAAVWLEPGVHRPTWWIRLHIGRALLRHDQMMLEILRSFSVEGKGGGSYARRSAWLETCALDGLRSLRVAFDTLPFDPREWSELQPFEKTLGPDDLDPDLKPAILNLEIALIQAWMKLFVAAFGAHHTLLGTLQLPSLAVSSVPSSGWDQYHGSIRAQVSNLKDDRVIPLANLLEVHGFWKAKWVPWCEMRQFHRFVKDSGELFSDTNAEGSQLILPTVKVSQNSGTVSSIRGYNIFVDVVQRARIVSEKESIVAQMWDSRRKGLSK